MAANQAQIEISAVDKTRAAFDSVARGMRTMETSAAAVNGIMARLAPLVGAASFTAFAKNTIDTADAMNDMAARTGIAVERLSAWRLVSEQSGTDLNSLAGALAKASKYMVENADNLKALGINGKTAEEVIIQLSDVIASLPADDPRRAALAMEVLGKSAAEMLPFLSQGGDAIRKMVKESERLPGITTDMAKSADAFNDSLTKLRITAEASGGKLLMPLIDDATEFMNKVDEIINTISTLEKAYKTLQLIADLPITPAGLARKLTNQDESDRYKFGGEGKIKRAGSTVTPEEITKVLAGGEKSKQKSAGSIASRPLDIADLYFEDIRQGSKDAADEQRALADEFDRVTKALAEQAQAWADMEEMQRQAADYSLSDIEAQSQAETDRIAGLEKQAQALRELLDPSIALMNQQDEYFQMLSEGIITAEEYSAALEKMGESSKVTNDLAKDIGLTFSSAFEDAVVSGKKFGDVLQSLAQDIEKMILRKTITKPLTDWVDGLDFGNIFSSIFSANANGGVYASPGLSAYSGQIVSSPTVFPFAKGVGLMGEAGPEAILPLKRGADGRLGVSADGGGSGGVVVNIIEAPGNGGSVNQSRDDNGVLTVDIMVEQVEGRLARKVNRGEGVLTKTLENVYGLGRGTGPQR